MSGEDGGARSGGRDGLKAKRGKPAYFWVAALALIVLSVVVAMVAAGLLDPLPKKTILKAGEMDGIIDLDGQWEQVSLHCFEEGGGPDGALQAAHSILHYRNTTSDLAMSITVADMGSEGAAAVAFEGDADDRYGVDHMDVSVGTRGYLQGYGHPGKDVYRTSWLYFYQGHYFVEMYFDGTDIDTDVILDIAKGQASRL